MHTHIYNTYTYIQYIHTITHIHIHIHTYTHPYIHTKQIQTYIRKEGRKCFFYRRTQHILFTVIWRHTYGKGPLSERKPTAATRATFSD